MTVFAPIVDLFTSLMPARTPALPKEYLDGERKERSPHNIRIEKPEYISPIEHNESFLRFGSRGREVIWLQERLGIEVTGVFDQKTVQAVMEFQERNHILKGDGSVVRLAVDGIVGPRTMRALLIKNRVDTLSIPEFEKVIDYKWDQDDGYKLLKERCGIDVPSLPSFSPYNLCDKKFESVMRKYTKENSTPPISGKRFLDTCKEYNIDPTLALAQAAQESNVGTNGRRSLNTKNMFNVGNTDSGKNRKMGSWEEGLEVYCRVMATQYYNTAEHCIDNNFLRPIGGRYASDPDYTYKIAWLVRGIRNELMKP